MKSPGQSVEDEPTELGRRLVSRFAGASGGKREIKMTPNFDENNLVGGGAVNGNGCFFSPFYCLNDHMKRC